MSKSLRDLSEELRELKQQLDKALNFILSVEESIDWLLTSGGRPEVGEISLSKIEQAREALLVAIMNWNLVLSEDDDLALKTMQALRRIVPVNVWVTEGDMWHVSRGKPPDATVFTGKTLLQAIELYEAVEGTER